MLWCFSLLHTECLSVFGTWYTYIFYISSQIDNQIFRLWTSLLTFIYKWVQLTFIWIVIPIVKCCSSPSRPIDRIIFFFKPPQVNGYWQNRIWIFKLKISKNFLIIIIWLDLDRVWILGRCYLKLHRPRYGWRLKILWIPDSRSLRSGRNESSSRKNMQTPCKNSKISQKGPWLALVKLIPSG